MPTLVPFGARLMVIPLEAENDIVKRGEKIGLKVIVEEKNQARSTRGRVVAVGTDPLLQEYVHVGDDVLFSPYAGIETTIEGVTYLSLELREVTHVIVPDPKLPGN